MAVQFQAPFRHGKLMLPPSLSLAFEDENAEGYFIAVGAAEATEDAPVMTYPAGSVEIDPETTFGTGDRRGQKVLEA